MGVLDYITHNAYTQVHHNLAYCVRSPRRDLVHLVVMHMIAPMRHKSRRDHTHIVAHMYLSLIHI